MAWSLAELPPSGRRPGPSSPDRPDGRIRSDGPIIWWMGARLAVVQLYRALAGSWKAAPVAEATRATGGGT